MKTILFVLATAVFSATQLLHAQVQQQHKGEIAAHGSLYLRAEPISNFYLANKPDNPISLYVHLQGVSKRSENEKKIPLNLSVVIDRSGSMHGDKIAYVKKATEYLINQLSENDFLSIVLYDTEVEVLCKPQGVKDKPSLISKVKTIVTGSSTNLEGGMRKGFELVKDVKSLLGSQQEMVNRVLLLSDGLANVGISDPGQLSAIVKKFSTDDKISISTFGVGADYNEDLMTKLAIQGGGKYYFISSPENLPTLFLEELNGISSLVAKNAVLSVDFPEDKLKINKVYLYDYIEGDGKILIRFNDVFAEEQKAVIIQFIPIGKIEDTLEFGCTLTYANSTETAKDIKHEKTISVAPADNLKRFTSGYNKAASEGFALHASGEKFEEAMQLANNRNFDEAMKSVKNAEQILENHFSIFGEHPFLKELYNNFKSYEKVIKELEDEKDPYRFRLHIKSGKARKFRVVSAPAF